MGFYNDEILFVLRADLLSLIV